MLSLNVYVQDQMRLYAGGLGLTQFNELILGLRGDCVHTSFT